MPLIIRRQQVLGAGTSVQIIPFPDLVGQVVRVHRVGINLAGFGAASAIANALDHNTSLAIAIQINDSSSMWCRIDSAFGNNPNQAPNLQVYDPIPEEMVGPQRWVTVNSVGNIDVFVHILYSIRNEPSLTKWTDLRARTSFERG